MGRSELKNKNIRKITKCGNSRNVTIPKEILEELGWREKQKVVVKKRGKGIYIEDWEK